MSLLLSRGLADDVRTDGVAARLLQCLAFLTVGLASVEGYLLEINDSVTKLPAALLVVTWFVVRARALRLPRYSPAHLPLAVLTVAVLASTALHSGDTFTLTYTQRWVSFLLTAFVLLDVAAREVPVRVLVWAGVLGASVAGGGALWSFLVQDAPRATGPMEDPNDLAYVLVAAVPLLVALFEPRRTPGARPLPRAAVPIIGVLLVVLVVGAAVTVSRGGLIGLAAALAWLAVRRTFPVKVLVGAGVALAGAGIVLAVGFGSMIDQALSQKEQVASANVDARATRWQAGLAMLPADPVLGVGPGGFRSNYIGVSHNAELVEQTPVAHNMYVEVAAELGLVGLAGFVGLIGVAFVASERAVTAAGAGPERLLPLAVQGSLIAICVSSIFLSEQYYMPLWATIAVACALGLRAPPPTLERGAVR